MMKLLIALGLGGAGIGTSALLAGGGGERPTIQAGPSPEQAVGREALGRALTVPQGALALDRALGVEGPAAGPGGEMFFDLDTGQIVPGGPTGAEALEAIVRRNLAGQGALSQFLAEAAQREVGAEREQTGAERLLRLTALTDVPLFMGGYERDATRALLEDRLGRALRGEFSSPALERRLGETERTLRGGLFRQLGSGYELSTPGIQALSEFGRGAEELRGEEGRREIAALSGLEAGRRQLEEAVRGRGLQERLALTGLGRTPTQQLLTGFQGMVPVAPLLGIESPAEQRQREALQFQSALSGFESEQAGRRALAQSVSNLFGLGSASLLFR